jgi:hypothetical protein
MSHALTQRYKRRTGPGFHSTTRASAYHKYFKIHQNDDKGKSRHGLMGGGESWGVEGMTLVVTAHLGGSQEWYN